MNCKLKNDGIVSISMKDYIEEYIASYGGEINNDNTKTPTNGKLISVDTPSNKLNQDKANIFTTLLLNYYL